MFAIGNLEIRILKLLAEKSFSTISLYEVLTKEGTNKIQFESAVVSLERKKLIGRESVMLLLADNGKKMLEILENANLSSTNRSKIPGKSRRKYKFIGNLDVARHGKSSRNEIYEDIERYRIISSRSKNPSNHIHIKKNTFEKVYNYLKKDGKRFVSEIENATHLSPTTIHNAMKILRVQKKADYKVVGKKRKFLYFLL